MVIEVKVIYNHHGILYWNPINFKTLKSLWKTDEKCYVTLYKVPHKYILTFEKSKNWV